MPSPEETQEQRVEENYLLEDLKFSPSQVKRWFVSNIFQRTFAHLVGWTGKKAVMLRCLSDGTLKVTSEAVGKSTGSYGQVSVTTSPTLIRATNTDRISIIVKNHGLEDVYIGFTDTVTTDTGFKLESGAAVSFDVYLGPIYAVASTGTQKVSYMEV